MFELIGFLVVYTGAAVGVVFVGYTAYWYGAKVWRRAGRGHGR